METFSQRHFWVLSKVLEFIIIVSVVAKFNFKMQGFPFIWFKCAFASLLMIRDSFRSINKQGRRIKETKDKNWKQRGERLAQGIRKSWRKTKAPHRWGQSSLRWRPWLQGRGRRGGRKWPCPTRRALLCRCLLHPWLDHGTAHAQACSAHPKSSSLGLRFCLAAGTGLFLTLGSHLPCSRRPPFLSLNPSPCPAPLCWTYPRPWVIRSPTLFCKNLFSKSPAPPFTPLLSTSGFMDFPEVTLCLPTGMSL